MYGLDRTALIEPHALALPQGVKPRRIGERGSAYTSTVLRTGQAYQLRDTAGQPITIAEGRAIIAEHYSIPPDLRSARRRNPAPTRTAARVASQATAA
jgi:hypothetical protein